MVLLVAFRGRCGRGFVVIGVVVITGGCDGIWVARWRVRRWLVDEGEIVGGHWKLGLGLRFRFGGEADDVGKTTLEGRVTERGVWF